MGCYVQTSTEQVLSDLSVDIAIGNNKKSEIIEIARRIDTYELSSLPYEDCCTIFTPKHPATRPRKEKVAEAEAVLDLEGLIERALDQVEVVSV